MPAAIKADLDGDGVVEEIIGTDPAGTVVVKNGVTIWSNNGWIGGWNRGPTDRFLVAGDLDGDGRQEVLIDNGRNDTYTGVFKWEPSALEVPWATHGAIDGWNRAPSDEFASTPVDLDGDGRREILIVNGSGDWTGVLKLGADRLHLLHAVHGVIDGWSRNTYDRFWSIGDIDGTGRGRYLISNGMDYWTGILTFDANALHVHWGSPSPLRGPTGLLFYRHATDSFGTELYEGKPSVAVWGEGGNATLQWQGGALVVVQSTSHEHPPPPPPPQTIVPNISGVIMTAAEQLLQAAHLKPGVVWNLTGEIRTDYLRVSRGSENPAPGAHVGVGTPVSFAVELAAGTTVTGYSAMEISNGVSRPVRVFVWTNTANSWTDEGFLEPRSSMTVRMASGPTYWLSVIDPAFTGRDGTPDNVSCQRLTWAGVGDTNGATMPLNVV